MGYCSRGGTQNQLLNVKQSFPKTGLHTCSADQQQHPVVMLQHTDLSEALTGSRNIISVKHCLLRDKKHQHEPGICLPRM